MKRKLLGKILRGLSEVENLVYLTDRLHATMADLVSSVRMLARRPYPVRIVVRGEADEDHPDCPIGRIIWLLPGDAETVILQSDVTMKNPTIECSNGIMTMVRVANNELLQCNPDCGITWVQYNGVITPANSIQLRVCLPEKDLDFKTYL